MAKRRRVLTLEFPGEPTEQERRDVLAFVQTRLAAAGHADAEVIVLTNGWRLREAVGPAPKADQGGIDRGQFMELSEQMYAAITGAGG